MGLVFILDCSASSSLYVIHRALDIMETYPDDTECSVYYFNTSYDCIIDHRPLRYISYERLKESFFPCKSTALYDTVCSLVPKCGWFDRVYIIYDGRGDTSSSKYTKSDMDTILYWRPFIQFVIEEGETPSPVYPGPPLVRSTGSMFDSATLDSG